MADWHRIKTVYERVHPQCIEAMLQFRATNGFGDIPQNWFRQAWALLEQGSSQRTIKQNESLSVEAQYLYVRRLLAQVLNLATKRVKEREELQGSHDAFQQAAKSVLQKKVFNEDHRRDQAKLTQTYSAGMSCAERHHQLTRDCLAGFDDRFIQGDFDAELKLVSNPALLGHIFFVA